jgi:radical SAM peptide maturase (CXXX-repeat target family)
MTKKQVKTKRIFIQFNDWISKMYPELHRQGTEKVKPGELGTLARNFTFQVTDKCNLACTYCYQINKSTRRMKLEDAKKAVDNLLHESNGFDKFATVEKSPAIILEFIGGEPFLEIDLIDQIVDYFREQAILMNHPWAERFAISICSNGILYTDERVQKFLLKNHGILSFSVTVDGVQELHDSCRVFPDGKPSYHLAHHAAMDWMSRGYDMGSKITISPNNITYLAECMKKMIDDGYYEINANYVYEDGWELKHATEAYKQIKKFTDDTVDDYDYNSLVISFLNNNGTPIPANDNRNYCGGTGSMLSMDPDGYLYPCIRYMESSIGTKVPPVRIGHISTGLRQKKCEDDCLKCMLTANRRGQSEDKCFYCPVASGCGWCSGYNYQVFGTVHKRTTYICIVHKARTLATCYYINKHIASGDEGTPQPLLLPESEAVEIIGQEQYDELVALTESVGGYVNKTNKSMVHIKHGHEGGIGATTGYSDEDLEYFDPDDTETLNKFIEMDKDILGNP